jgi:hypothetical protein
MWKDIAILTGRLENCTFYQAESQNVKAKNYCSNPAYNNEVACRGKGADWLSAPAWGIKAPECKEAPWNRPNQLGNTPYNSKSEFTTSSYKSPQEMNSYNWTIPLIPADKCVFRLRYNISTNDYADWVINSTFNDDTNSRNKRGGKYISPIQQDPVVELGDYRGLTLAINTNQFARTFQDRSHVFSIIPKLPNVPQGATVWNLNVRGRRGNIVQNYPAVEYDFIPRRLELKAIDDYVHWQWTGSNNNPNNDGQGKAGTDRSNVVQIEKLVDNYPLPKEIASSPALGGMFSTLAEVEKVLLIDFDLNVISFFFFFFFFAPKKRTRKKKKKG